MNNELKVIYTFRVKRNNKVKKTKTYLFQEDCWKLIKAFMFNPAECCGKHCDETCGLKWVMGFNRHYIDVCDRLKRQPFCDYHITDYTTDTCCDCNITLPYTKLTFIGDDESICKPCLALRPFLPVSPRDYQLNTCGCKSSYDLRSLCYPKKDYRKTTKDNDFRYCPMRFTSATEFILNDYDKYKLIENATTVKDKIKIFKKIIIKDFKLSTTDFERILKNYLAEEDNIINPILRDEDVEDCE